MSNMNLDETLEDILWELQNLNARVMLLVDKLERQADGNRKLLREMSPLVHNEPQQLNLPF